jgi:DNA repair protein RecO (recombination protein O)
VSAPERAYKTRGFVLRARNLGEADKIYTLFTQDRGKLDAVGKGVRRAKSRLAGKLEFMSEAALTMHRGRNLDVITGADIGREHWAAVVNPAGFATAHVIAELVDAFCELDLPMPEIYALMRGVLRALADAPDPALLVPRFALRLLGTLGYAPMSDACIRCARPLAGEPAFADLEAGGLACEGCRPRSADALSLSAADVVNFQGLAAPAGGDVRAVLHATPAAARAVEAFVTWHLGKRTKSSKLLDELAHA